MWFNSHAPSSISLAADSLLIDLIETLVCWWRCIEVRRMTKFEPSCRLSFEDRTVTYHILQRCGVQAIECRAGTLWSLMRLLCIRNQLESDVIYYADIRRIKFLLKSTFEVAVIRIKFRRLIVFNYFENLSCFEQALVRVSFSGEHDSPTKPLPKIQHEKLF